MNEARRRLTVIALAQIDDADRSDRYPDEVVERIRVGYEAQLARIERQIGAIGFGPADGKSAARSDGDVGSETATQAGSDGDADPAAMLLAERELRQFVIAAERLELEELVSRGKIANRVADGVRTALDVDETTMRP